MNIRTFYLKRIAWNRIAAIAVMSLISPVRAENPPPCDPCKVELEPTAIASHIRPDVGPPQVGGRAGYDIPVTWTAVDVPRGAFTPECSNINGAGLQSFDGWYVPTTMKKTYHLSAGRKRFAISDNFYARFFDPCKGGAFKSGGFTYNIVSVEAPLRRTPNPNPEPGDPPPPIDPNQQEEETPDPCPSPFYPGQFFPFDHVDRRLPKTLTKPNQVEIVSENIGFNHEKNGFIQYNYDPVTTLIPKYFLREQATTTLSGGSPESPVGGSVTRLISPMTGELIEVAKTGNPSWYGVRSGPNVTLTETTASGSFDVSSYDDCPNVQPDEPGVMAFTAVLSDEYTKERMRDDAFQYAWAFKGTGYYWYATASAVLLIDPSEETIQYQKTQYKIRVPADTPRPYEVSWVEEFTPEDTNPSDEVTPKKELVFKNTTITGSESEIYTINPMLTPTKEGVWRVYLIEVNACVDVDRNLSIAFDGSDLTKSSKPYRFWINDDRDFLHQQDPLPPPAGHGGILEEDDVLSDEKPLADCDDSGLLYLRDLEDLDRIHVNYSSVVSYMQNAGLEDSDIMIKARMDAVDGSPSLNFFTAVELDGGREYLVGSVGDTSQDDYPPSGIPSDQLLGQFGIILASVNTGGEVVVQDVNRDARNNATMALLYEGKTSGKCKLYFDFYLDGTKIASSQAIHLDLRPVEELYETWSVGDASVGGTPFGDWPNVVPEHTKGKNITVPETAAERDYTLMVHGWNVPGWEKSKLFGDTQYKRMWQLGYKGRFGIFTWPTFYDFPSLSNLLIHFNGSEERAWNSAQGLKSVIENRHAAGFRVRLNGHSMGNVVCGEALRLFKESGRAAPLHTYISQQAAISAHAWDSSTPTVLQQSDSTIPDIYGKYWRSGLSYVDTRTWSAVAAPISYHNVIYQHANVRYINHWNSEDWALKQFVVNNRLKPSYPKYDYRDADGTIRLANDEFSNYTMVFPLDRYQAFAWAAKSYSYPTGAEGATGGSFDTSESYDLTYMFGDTHPGHSAQWRSTIHRRADYWLKFIEQMKYAE